MKENSQPEAFKKREIRRIMQRLKFATRFPGPSLDPKENERLFSQFC